MDSGVTPGRVEFSCAGAIIHTELFSHSDALGVLDMRSDHPD